MSTNDAKKRGRPPRTFTSSDGTKIALRDIGMTRQRISQAIAIASLPQAIFETELARKDRKPSSRALANLARGRPIDHRHGSPLTEAMRVVQQLSADQRIALAIAALSHDELRRVMERVEPTP